VLAYLGVISVNAEAGVVAAPGLSIGQVQFVPLHEPNARMERPIITAHTSPLSCMALSPDASRLATASEKVMDVFLPWDSSDFR
jgi:hypothetical protein